MNAITGIPIFFLQSGFFPYKLSPFHLPGHCLLHLLLRGLAPVLRAAPLALRGALGLPGLDEERQERLLPAQLHGPLQVLLLRRAPQGARGSRHI